MDTYSKTGDRYRRRRGQSGNKNKRFVSSGPEKSIVGKIINGLLNAVFSDLQKPDSVLKRIGSHFFKKPKKTIELSENKKEFIDVKYKSIEGRKKDG